MWYLASLLFTEEKPQIKAKQVCESCRVLLDAPTANHAYEKALNWAGHHEREMPYKFVGVMSLSWIGEEQPKDGDDLGGAVFDEPDVWGRVSELIPEKSELTAIMMEANWDGPIGELVTEDEKRRLEISFGAEEEDTHLH